MNQKILDILENNKLKYIDKIEDYFKKYREKELFTILPALESIDSEAQPYYSVGLFSDDNIRVSPVFLLINPDFDVSNFEEREDILFFDSESPYVYETNIYGITRRKKAKNFEEIVNYVAQHPVMLIFKGCDDGDIAKRFKTKEEAIEFLSLLEKFEDVFEFDITYLN